MRKRLDQPVDFAAWRQAHRMTVVAAAAALGISRTSIVKYEKNGALVPRVVRLAMVGVEQEITP